MPRRGDVDVHSAWVKHEAARYFCAVDQAGPHSIITHCRGRMAITDDYEIHDEPAAAERCGGCVRRLDELERIERGLAEMIAATGGE